MILLVDDDPTQRKLARIRLAAEGFEVETATGGDEALAKARARRPDVILSDVLMGDLDGFTLCRKLREDPRFDDVPVILLSAHYQDEPDQHLATRVGASALLARSPDFDAELAAVYRVLATRPVTSGVPTTELYEEQLRSNATQVARLLGQARTAEERYRALFDCADDAIAVLTPGGVVLDLNGRWGEIIGVPVADLIGRPLHELADAEGNHAAVAAYSDAMAGGTGRARLHATPIRGRDGRITYLDFSINQLELDGEQVVLSIGRDVTKAVLDAEALAAAENKYRALVERIPDVIWSSTLAGVITFMTPNIAGVLGFTAEEVCAETYEQRMAGVHPDDAAAVSAAFRAHRELGRPVDLEYRRQHKDGQWVWIRNRLTASYEQGGVRHLEGMISDVTERHRLEETIQQAQKMEAIGQLTGGIAHDFNNILASILANSHFLIEDLAERDPRREMADEIRIAAERAAALTRQLLAFGRRQMLEPAVIDLNSVVVGIEKMLQRLIGEDLALITNLGLSPGATKVDIGQLEQVILNLVVNARDAMPSGGPITITTRNVKLDVDAPQLPAGRYVVLSVADAGVGMDAETQRRIFEPFYTTKPPGKGTGLGLSTCYGIVTQSGGYIVVRSQLDVGTEFEIYLPRVAERPEPAIERRADVEAGGTETILLIEDDDRVRRAIVRILEPRGYRMLIAASGTKALALVDRTAEAIDLVISDVVMPGLSGPEVVEALREQGCTPRTLFMSGYSTHDLLDRTDLQSRPNFIQKPFLPAALARKVREVLDAPC